MSLSLLLQPCPTCLVRLIWMVLKTGGRWPYNCCFVGCCSQDFLNIARSILVQLPSNFFSLRFVSVYVVHPYSRSDTTAAWKKFRFILSDRSYIYIYIYIYIYRYKRKKTITSALTRVYIYIYIHVCVCLCLCVCVSVNPILSATSKI